MKHVRTTGVLFLLALALPAHATRTRIRLERIDASEFPGSGRVRLYASVVELEGEVVEQLPAPAFSLTVDGAVVGAPEKVMPFAAAGDPLDLVLVIESSALYGPKIIEIPAPPPLAPRQLKKNGKHDKHGKAGKMGRNDPSRLPPLPTLKTVAGDAPLDKVKEAATQLLEALQKKWRVLVIDYAADVTAHPPFRPAAGAAGAVDELAPDDEASDLRLTDALHAALLELGKSPERRKLIVVPRETPLSTIQLENMRRASEAGAVVLPAMPGFYHGATTIRDLVDFVVARICDQLGLANSLMHRWGS